GCVARPLWLGKIDSFADALRAFCAIGGRGLVAWEADWLGADQCLDRLPEFRALSVADSPRERRGAAQSARYRARKPPREQYADSRHCRAGWLSSRLP